MSWTETTNETLTKKSILESKSVEGRYQGHFFKRTIIDKQHCLLIENLANFLSRKPN